MTDINLGELIPDRYVDYYADFAAREKLLEALSTSRFSGDSPSKLRKYCKLNPTYVWILLTVLKRLLGEDRFVKSVGLRLWDSALIMVDALPLNESELQNGLRILKTVMMNIKSPHVEIAEDVYRNGLWELYKDASRVTNQNLVPKMPAWDMIGIEKIQVPTFLDEV
ncbi:hypothetical protein A2415_04055 [candidate division WWE3 bacterium RIFOXYC1_FULL_39_7]|uniref:Uncharacterized protein n=2 Tax=Katanobacteria TaxID=422282 RepID=A0A1F4X4D0_UNCKA|nr:MAG: hypothetical protein A2415_04055 [candidate division WWE3 bacterium RIFOXYC1_FULL_39_7]OGC76560.1 MAG: hypothetical protein A2619_02460 [candidate division WWE3 bacterium RIFOXYD1_FULL_39_9]